MGIRAEPVAAVLPRQTTGARRGGLVDRYFYFAMTFVVTAVVVYGFSHTVGENLIHPTIPRPRLLYAHAALFTGWLVLFILQSTLVRARKVQWHRRIGLLGAAMGALIPLVGVSTAIVMERFDLRQLHQMSAEFDLMIPLWDMTAFTPVIAAAVYFRKKPEFHRRLMLVATCVLTAAGFGRFPERILPSYLFYSGVDVLILLGVARDLWVDGTVHRVYRYVLPVFVVGQTVVTYAVFHKLEYWRRIGHWLLSIGG